ncbi:MAG: hypothetical protein L3J39_13105 [Verrucomicrobiales bacterium]|nr:hypothetical protein [Verrucomicrobiales bacterium]
MKSYLFLFLSACLGFAGTLSVLAQEADFNPLGRDLPIERMAKQLRIQVEWIELSHQDYTALMAEKEINKPRVFKSSNDGPLRKKLEKMIAEDKAHVIDTAMVIARSGQRAKVESIQEVIYATEYENEGSKKEASKTRSLPIATAYETRNVGTTLEVDPVLGADDHTVDLSLSPEIVYLTDWEDFGGYIEGENEVIAKMPVFYTMKLTTQVTMIAGEYLLAGVQSPFDAEEMKMDRERKVMVFLKVDLLVVGLPLEKEKEKKKN